MIIMSNNQWKCDYNLPAWEKMGLDCSAEARVKGLVKAYKAILPDILGLQEVSIHLSELMMQELGTVRLPDGGKAEYEYVSGGDTPIVYRRDKYLLIESGFFRYPEAIPGLEGSFNNSETKSYAWGVFEDRLTGKKLAFMSTHLWWKSSHPASSFYQAGSNTARAWQIALASAEMERVMAKYNCPGVIVGDLNASVKSLCLEKAFSLGWKEIHDVAEERDETRGHHHCGGDGFSRDEPGLFETAIDHILLKNADGIRVPYFRRVTDEYLDPVTDHYPLYAELVY